MPSAFHPLPTPSRELEWQLRAPTRPGAVGSRRLRQLPNDWTSLLTSMLARMLQPMRRETSLGWLPIGRNAALAVDADIGWKPVWIGKAVEPQYAPRQLRFGTARCATTYRRYQQVTSPCSCRRTCRSGFTRSLSSLTRSATWLMQPVLEASVLRRRTRGTVGARFPYGRFEDMVKVLQHRSAGRLVRDGHDAHSRAMMSIITGAPDVAFRAQRGQRTLQASHGGPFRCRHLGEFSAVRAGGAGGARDGTRRASRKLSGSTGPARFERTRANEADELEPIGVSGGGSLTGSADRGGSC